MNQPCDSPIPSPDREAGDSEDASGQCSQSEPSGLSASGDAVHVAVHLDCDDPDPPDRAWLTDKLERAIAELAVTRARYDVIVINDPAMAAMHEQYASVAGTTDVLTFDLRDADSGAAIEGEAYICLDEARRQAGTRGDRIERELLLYALHGLLHLLGYDDHDPADHQRMHAREDEVLQAIGVGRVFGADGVAQP